MANVLLPESLAKIEEQAEVQLLLKGARGASVVRAASPSTPSTTCTRSVNGGFALSSSRDSDDLESCGSAACSGGRRPSAMQPLERLKVEAGLSVKNTFFDFEPEAEFHESIRRRASSAPPRPTSTRRTLVDDSSDSERVDILAAIAASTVLGADPDVLPKLPAPPACPMGPSWGSALHFSGRCKPCLFTNAPCANGEACLFCHLCEKKRKKESTNNFSWRQLRKATGARKSAGARAGR